MKPIRFEGWNTSFADEQPEYQSLPGHLREGTEGEFISCWKMSFFERLKVLFTGRVFLSVWTFNQPLQPQLPMVENPLLPFEKEAGRPLDWVKPASKNLCRNCGQPSEAHMAPAFKCPK
jgi:hypothetical protein